MFPSMGRQIGQFGGKEKQMGDGGYLGAMDSGGGLARYPGHKVLANGEGFDNYRLVMAQAQAAQVMRLQK